MAFLSSEGLSPARRIGSATAAIVLVLLIGYFFGIRGMRFFMVPTSSMEPTLLRRDHIVSMTEKNHQRGDVVVHRDPTEAGAYLVKRIVGLPGDVLSIEGGALFINGSYASEPYILEPMQITLDPPVQVPEDQVWVLGDNRNASEDSINWGHGIWMDDVIGKVHYIYRPLSRIGSVPSYPLRNIEGD